MSRAHDPCHRPHALWQARRMCSCMSTCPWRWLRLATWLGRGTPVCLSPCSPAWRPRGRVPGRRGMHLSRRRWRWTRLMRGSKGGHWMCTASGNSSLLCGRQLGQPRVAGPQQRSARRRGKLARPAMRQAMCTPGTCGQGEQSPLLLPQVRRPQLVHCLHEMHCCHGGSSRAHVADGLRRTTAPAARRAEVARWANDIRAEGLAALRAAAACSHSAVDATGQALLLALEQLKAGFAE